jgi:hypothetical protein
MTMRSILALALAGTAAIAVRTDTAQAQADITAGACPGMTALIVLSDYDGQHSLQLCVAPQGLHINGSTVHLDVYDGLSDGIFHNGFDSLP